MPDRFLGCIHARWSGIYRGVALRRESAGTLITLNSSQSIQLNGVTPSALHPNNFQIT